MVFITEQNGAGEPESTMSNLWQLDDLEYDCDCPGPPPPPPFKIPPPPRPPFLPELTDCAEYHLPDFDSCDLMTVIDAEYKGNPAIPTVAIVIVCATLLLAGAFIVFALAWKNKKKVQNLIPCKSTSQNRCDMAHANGVIYEDLSSVRRGQPPSMEMLAMKSRNSANNYVISGHSPVFICSAAAARSEHQYCPPPRADNRRYQCPQDLYNPVYEELSNGSNERGESDADSEFIHKVVGSEDEFAEDELSLGDHYHLPSTQQHSGTSSLQGSTGNDLYRDVDSSDADDRSRFLCHRAPCIRGQNGGGGGGSRNASLPPGRRNRGVNKQSSHRSQHSLPEQRRLKSLDRRRKTKGSGALGCGVPEQRNEFHEGYLLDNAYSGSYHPNSGNRSSNAVANDHRQLPYILPLRDSPSQDSAVVSPYESIPVMDHLRRQQNFHHGQTSQQHYGGNQYFPSFKPNRHNSHDSDSGYSNNTSGGRGSNSSRSRSETLQRLSSPNDCPL